ncbi:MAG: 2-isopropylmalate synthase, partial [Sulfitobacter sp.]
SKGEIEGKGIATYSNSDVYEGMFQSGKRHGTGTMRYGSGEAVTGEWVNGALQQQADAVQPPQPSEQASEPPSAVSE